MASEDSRNRDRVRGHQWMIFEERNDPLDEVGATLDRVPQKRFPVVVVPAVLDDASALEEPSKAFEGNA